MASRNHRPLATAATALVVALLATVARRGELGSPRRKATGATAASAGSLAGRPDRRNGHLRCRQRLDQLHTLRDEHAGGEELHGHRISRPRAGGSVRPHQSAVSGLEPSAAYTFSVTAANAAGRGNGIGAVGFDHPTGGPRPASPHLRSAVSRPRLSRSSRQAAARPSQALAPAPHHNLTYTDSAPRNSTNHPCCRLGLGLPSRPTAA